MEELFIKMVFEGEFMHKIGILVMDRQRQVVLLEREGRTKKILVPFWLICI